MKLNQFLKDIILGALFLVPFVPLVVVSSFFFPFVVGKAVLFRVLVEIAVGAWTILAIREKKYRPKFSWIFVGVLSLVIVMFLADLLGANPLKSFWSNYERMEGWVTLLHLLGYFVVIANFFNTEKIWKRFFNTSLVISVGVSFYGIFQMLGWVEASQGVSRLDITFGNSAYLAIYMIFHIFLAFFLLVRRQKWKDGGGYFYGGVILLNTYILYHTATRGAILGFLAAILLISFLIVLFEKKKIILKKISGGILLGTLILIGGFISLKDSNFVKENEILNRFATISWEEKTTKSRFMVWEMAWEGVKEKPILGWGQENFNYVFNQNYNPKMYGQEEWFDRTHNVFLDWLIAGGFLGLLAYLSLFGAFLYYLWSKQFGGNFSLLEKSIFTGLVAGYFIHNLFVFDNLISYILFFTILGFVHSQTLKEKDKEENWLDNFNENETFSKVVPIILIFITLFSIHFFNTKCVLANKALLQAIKPQPAGINENLNYYQKAFSYDSFADQEIEEQLMKFLVNIKSLDSEPKIKEDLLNLAIIEAEKEIKRDPQNTRTEVFLGSMLGSYGYFDKGLEHLQRGLELSPSKQSIMFEIGSTYINKGEYNEAFEILKRAYELEPNYEKAKNYYILSSIYADKESEIETVFGLMSEWGIELNMDFVNAYSNTGQKQKALEVLKNLVELHPENVQYHISLAAAYFETNQNAKSISELEKAIELDPNFKEQGEKFIENIKAGVKP